jgi:hypothetical protein
MSSETADASVPPGHDAAVLVADASIAPDAAMSRDGGVAALMVVRESFSVLFNDSSCSHHSHLLYVEAAEYADETPVRFLGGSHLLELRPSELLQLEAGERIPFATIGDGPGHAHCGTAWRTEVGPEEPDRPDVWRQMAALLAT